MARTIRRKGTSLITIFITLLLALGATAPRLYLGAGLPACLRADLVEDDLLMVRYAESLLKGEWLGELSGATLSKNAGFAAFLALLAKLNIPYIPGNVLFYCICVLIFCAAVYKLFPNPFASLALYIYLLYTPVMFHVAAAQRVCRTGFLSAVTLLLIGSLIGLFGTLVKGQHAIRTLLWSLCASAALLTFWLTEEDRAWMVVFATCVLAISAIVLVFGIQINPLGSTPGGFGAGSRNPGGRGSLFGGRKAKRHSGRARGKYPARGNGYVVLRMLCLALPAVSVGAGTFAIKYVNNQRYGEFAINDRSDTSFGRVLGDLYHIDDGAQPPEVWLSRAGLEQAFAVSPALAETKRYLDGMYEVSWAVNADGEMHGDALARALREAVEANGLYSKGGAVVNEYYKKVHAELEGAFENGSLPQDTRSIYLSSRGRGMTREEIRAFFPDRVPEMLEHMLRYDLNVTAALPAEGEAENVVRMALVARSPYVSADGANVSAFDTAIHFAEGDRAVYEGMGTFVTMLAAIGFLMQGILMIVGLFRRDYSRVPLMLVCLGMAVSAGVEIFAAMWLCSWQSMEAVYEELSGVMLIVNALQALGVSMLAAELARMAGRLRRMEE